MYVLESGQELAVIITASTDAGVTTPLPGKCGLENVHHTCYFNKGEVTSLTRA